MSTVYFSTWAEKLQDFRQQDTPRPEAKSCHLPAQFGRDDNLRAIFGWDGLVIYDPDVDLVAMATSYLEGVQAGSCGQCVPCPVGTKVMLDIFRKIGGGQGSLQDLDRLQFLSGQVRSGSMCDFGQKAPVPILDLLKHGSRLLAQDDAWRDRLVGVIGQWARQGRLSSLHSLFLSDDDQAAMERAGWMLRQGVQFHWTRDDAAPATDFTEFLSRMQRDKRKKIQQERRRVADQGLVFSVHEGEQIDEPLWDFFYRCYTLTYQAHHSTPYLTRDLFTRMARTMARHWVMFVARRRDMAGEPLAVSLVAIDPGRGAAWGRYWGCVQPLNCVHFEACYYQPLAWCIAKDYRRFEGGAQGEHKMARGLLPVRTASAHWLRDERFASAVGDFLAAEGTGIEQYVDELRERNPFKDA